MVCLDADKISSIKDEFSKHPDSAVDLHNFICVMEAHLDNYRGNLSGLAAGPADDDAAVARAASLSAATAAAKSANYETKGGGIDAADVVRGWVSCANCEALWQREGGVCVSIRIRGTSQRPIRGAAACVCLFRRTKRRMVAFAFLARDCSSVHLYESSGLAHVLFSLSLSLSLCLSLCLSHSLHSLCLCLSRGVASTRHVPRRSTPIARAWCMT